MANTNTTRSFNSMLNEYLPNTLLMEELIKRDYLLSKVAKDESWKTGDVIVPFMGAPATSVSFGSLTAASDIAEYETVRGSITAYNEVWGSLIFNEADLQAHNGKIPETSFLRILPDQIDQFMQYFKEAVSIQLTTGPHFATCTSDTDAASGKYVVDRVDRFYLGQKCSIDDDNSSPADAYVIAIDVTTKEVTFSDSRGGSAFNFSAYTVAQNVKLYHPGVLANGDNSFISLERALLSAANGGDTNLHGVAKTAYPYLQAYNHSGASISATNIVEELFDAFLEHRIRARGKANTFVMSYKNWGSVMKSQQIEKGQYKVVSDPKRSEFGWHEVSIASTVRGESLVVAGVQEMPDDIIYALDFDSMTFRSNGGFKKRIDPNGNMYHVVRNTTGYQYIVDVCLFGELEHTKPNHNMVIHSISY